MSDDLVFYTNPMSRGRIVRWMLEEIGQPYRTEILAYGPPMRAPAYLAVNPMGKVPALRHGAAVVTEAAAICAYLADAFPAAGLAPAPRDPLRGAYYRWLFFGAGPVEAVVSDTALGVTVPPDKEAMVGYGSKDRVMAVLEAAVGQGDYLLGERFSAADVYLGSELSWGMAFGVLEKRPALERYVARIEARPAAIRARETDDALLPPGGAA
ncbi:glutathione S-transferase family protein [Roseomonas sp. KE0001]|uniref:glutathione S-transferase family protein n=1 Tax=Roseomonas sp. KE0001 TaxID=2479201 RepID=UPI0018DFDCCD|nr:glutathione S-transferase family protein [Roseomonas sp. KE0001]MBI0434711.1 glutathione S-transferase family protein [Roseomonas sp. KE0001]